MKIRRLDLALLLSADVTGVIPKPSHYALWAGAAIILGMMVRRRL